MRDQGRLVEWFDDKGYGFIQPNDATKDRVFLHIKDFARQGPRPIVVCALEYKVLLDGQGRFRAQQVTYLKASQMQEKITKLKKENGQQQKKLKAMQIVCIAYILALAVFSIAGLLNGMVLLFIGIRPIGCMHRIKRRRYRAIAVYLNRLYIFYLFWAVGLQLGWHRKNCDIKQKNNRLERFIFVP